MIEELPLNMKLLKIENNSTLIVEARDYIVLNYTIINTDDESMIVLNGSIEDPCCPIDDDYIRGDIKIAGIKVIPTKNGESTIMTISVTDYKGFIPDKIKVKIGKQQSTKINSILSGFKKRFRK